MRASIIISTIFAASTLAAPLAAESAKRDLSLDATVDNVDLTTGVTIEGLDLGLDDVTGLVGDLDLGKRQLGLDLTPVTDLVGGLLTTVAGLLPTLTSEISDVEALVGALVDGTVTDVEATITQITSTLNNVIAQLGGLDLGSLGSLTKRQVNASVDVNVDLSSLVDTVTGLLNTVTGLTGAVDVSSVVGLVQDVLDTLTGLTSILGLKKL